MANARHTIERLNEIKLQEPVANFSDFKGIFNEYDFSLFESSIEKDKLLETMSSLHEQIVSLCESPIYTEIRSEINKKYRTNFYYVDSKENGRSLSPECKTTFSFQSIDSSNGSSESDTSPVKQEEELLIISQPISKAYETLEKLQVENISLTTQMINQNPSEVSLLNEGIDKYKKRIILFAKYKPRIEKLNYVNDCLRFIIQEAVLNYANQLFEDGDSEQKVIDKINAFNNLFLGIARLRIEKNKSRLAFAIINNPESCIRDFLNKINESSLLLYRRSNPKEIQVKTALIAQLKALSNKFESLADGDLTSIIKIIKKEDSFAKILDETSILIEEEPPFLSLPEEEQSIITSKNYLQEESKGIQERERAILKDVKAIQNEINDVKKFLNQEKENIRFDMLKTIYHRAVAVINEINESKEEISNILRKKLRERFTLIELNISRLTHLRQDLISLKKQLVQNAAEIELLIKGINNLLKTARIMKDSYNKTIVEQGRAIAIDSYHTSLKETEDEFEKLSASFQVYAEYKPSYSDVFIQKNEMEVFFKELAEKRNGVFSKKLELMNDVLQKKGRFEFNQEELENFESLKANLEAKIASLDDMIKQIGEKLSLINDHQNDIKQYNDDLTAQRVKIQEQLEGATAELDKFITAAKDDEKTSSQELKMGDLNKYKEKIEKCRQTVRSIDEPSLQTLTGNKDSFRESILSDPNLEEVFANLEKASKGVITILKIKQSLDQKIQDIKTESKIDAMQQIAQQGMELYVSFCQERGLLTSLSSSINSNILKRFLQECEAIPSPKDFFDQLIHQAKLESIREKYQSQLRIFTELSEEKVPYIDIPAMQAKKAELLILNREYQSEAKQEINSNLESELEIIICKTESRMLKDTYKALQEKAVYLEKEAFHLNAECKKILSCEDKAENIPFIMSNLPTEISLLSSLLMNFGRKFVSVKNSLRSDFISTIADLTQPIKALAQQKERPTCAIIQLDRDHRLSELKFSTDTAYVFYGEDLVYLDQERRAKVLLAATKREVEDPVTKMRKFVYIPHPAKVELLAELTKNSNSIPREASSNDLMMIEKIAKHKLSKCEYILSVEEKIYTTAISYQQRFNNLFHQGIKDDFVLKLKLKLIKAAIESNPEWWESQMRSLWFTDSIKITSTSSEQKEIVIPRPQRVKRIHDILSDTTDNAKTIFAKVLAEVDQNLKGHASDLSSKTTQFFIKKDQLELFYLGVKALASMTLEEIAPTFQFIHEKIMGENGNDINKSNNPVRHILGLGKIYHSHQYQRRQSSSQSSQPVAVSNMPKP